MVILERKKAINLLTTSIALATGPRNIGQGKGRRQRGSFVGETNSANGLESAAEAVLTEVRTGWVK
jgi:hypothetical protein